MPVHGDRIELAHPLAIRQAKTAPGTALAATSHQAGRAAGIHAAIVAVPARHIAAPGAGEPGSDFFACAQFNAEKISNLLVHLDTVDRAGSRFDLVEYQLLRKRTTTRSPAGSTIGMRQHVFDLIDAGVFVDKQAAIGKRQYRRQNQAEADHESDG